MKIFIFIGISLILFYSCNVSNKMKLTATDNFIVYVLPTTVEDLLNIKIENMKSKDNIYFCLYKDSGFFHIYISEAINTANQFVSKTNRKVFVAGKFYPIIFESDIFFGTSSSPAEIVEYYNHNKYLEVRRSYIINEGFNIKFDKEGKIFENGVR
jgi:hypothetical protein